MSQRWVISSKIRSSATNGLAAVSSTRRWMHHRDRQLRRRPYTIYTHLLWLSQQTTSINNNIEHHRTHIELTYRFFVIFKVRRKCEKWIKSWCLLYMVVYYFVVFKFASNNNQLSARDGIAANSMNSSNPHTFEYIHIYGHVFHTTCGGVKRKEYEQRTPSDLLCASWDYGIDWCVKCRW